MAIFNSRPDFIEALRAALEADGFVTATAHLADIQDGTLDLLAFVHLHEPELIIYDLPRPYERHWNFLRFLKETASLKDVTWVLTTTDKQALEGAVGASGGSSRSSSGSPTAAWTSWTPCARRCRDHEGLVHS